MRHDPVFLAFDIRCPSPDEAAKVEEMVRRLGRRDAIHTDTVTGGGKTAEVSHRIGDYFEDILVLPRVGEDARALRLVFHRRPDAGRSWKDLMVRIVRAVEQRDPSPSVVLAYRGDEALGWEHLVAPTPP
jgi:hypothetical protein